MKQTVIQVDAFTAKPFQGNPAAVCVLNEPADETWMQLVAREMNLSETAFDFCYCNLAIADSKVNSLLLKFFNSRSIPYYFIFYVYLRINFFMFKKPNM